MNLDQIHKAARKYRMALPDATKQDTSAKGPDFLEVVRHCAWMCDEIVKGAMSQDKAMRWLCFVQGCLWTHGIYTIDEMKDDNRS